MSALQVKIGRVEHFNLLAILLAFTVSDPVALVISNTVFNIISFVIFA